MTILTDIRYTSKLILETKEFFFSKILHLFFFFMPFNYLLAQTIQPFKILIIFSQNLQHQRRANKNFVVCKKKYDQKITRVMDQGLFS